ncbi:glycosidase [Frankia sp. AgB1.9]|uniref:glycoside hydrolase family 26 protein n=1 Tax=unclassified Frankia TaxID=2632575 RepID=UPI001933A126|nr:MULTISPECIES: glycosyl hydrolase [unclassified Frankia]MBL7487857.1 glycosidase [Frankia sp. AgW1.1]MBL7547163.1 glycosidase [Frankia sp. AgB1.9]MBL7620101.1 glycosidase [Frankia sp. AgB1.8]
MLRASRARDAGPALAVALLLVVAGLGACSHSAPRRPSAPVAVANPSVAGTGVRWVSGANGNFPSEIEPWAAWTGRPVDLAMIFTSRTDWNSVESPDWPLDAFTTAAWPGQISIAQPLWPDSGGNERDCAAGAYDEHWHRFGENLLKYGRGDAIVRLGWEFNGDWYDWYPRDVNVWKQCYQRTVTALRDTAPDVRIDWTMTMHRDDLPRGGDVWSAYPGDAYVDIIGIDYYDMSPPASTQGLWDRLCVAPSGLCTVIQQARARGKKFSVPEWGVVSGAGGGGDNPFFIQKMYAMFQANAGILAYEAYYNNADADNVRSSLLNPTLNPRSAQRYLQLFGPG